MVSERLKGCSLESSNGFNNAGTGHAGYCELNYTPFDEKTQSVDTTKAVKVNNAFNKSIQFWEYLVKIGEIKPDFLKHTPHYSFVQGEKSVKYLKLRYEAMKVLDNFKGMEFTDDMDEIAKELPLVMEGRDRSVPVAISKIKNGYDIDFGKLTKYLVDYLNRNGVKIKYETEVLDLYKVGDKWHIIQRNLVTDELTRVVSDFVFIGAGGAAITLLEKSGIPEGKHYGGFPVAGEFLICDNPVIVKQHNAKLYGEPAIGSPPMSTPHLDTRVIDGKEYF
jgi:malate dehydrogenase (quinone)